MLAVSGRLSQVRGGPTLPVDVPGNLSTALTGSLKADARFPEALRFRRSIYQPQKRKAPFDEVGFLAPFDLPDPSQETGRRSATTVPTQALSLLNSPFAKQCAAAIAEDLISGTTDEEPRIRATYLRVYGRLPTAVEVAESSKFLADSGAPGEDPQSPGLAESEAWARLCQSLLISNEFLFRE